MKYLLDSCVGLKLVLVEKDSHLADALMDDFKNQVHELIAADCYLAECAHAITRAERKGIVKPPEGQQKFQEIVDTCPTLHPIFRFFLGRLKSLQRRFMGSTIRF